MKKLILFTYIFSIINLAVFSQSLSLLNNGTPISNNSTISVSGSFNSTLTFSALQIKNNSTSTVSVKMRKVTIDSVPNSTNTYCFAGNCFGNITYPSPTTAIIATDSLNLTFIGDYYPNGKSGTTTVLYTFFNINNLQDTVCVKIAYTGLDDTGINEILRSDIVFRDVYPNPSNSVATFSYSLPKQATTAKIVLRNLLGSEVMNVNLDDMTGKKTISTTDIKEGIYFYSLIVNDKVFYTRKLVVKH